MTELFIFKRLKTLSEFAGKINHTLVICQFYVLVYWYAKHWFSSFFCDKMLKLGPSPSNFHSRLSVIIKVLCRQSTKELSFLGNIVMIPLSEF